MVNYYKILKVSPKASSAEIKSAYRRLARKLHPDINSTSPKASEEFAVVAKAYEILSDPHERAYFDKQLAKGNGSIHTTDSVFYSDNAHAQKLRQMAIEHRYNQIVDEMINADRRETLALQKVLFPTVGLFVSTFAVAIFRPNLWSNSEMFGKIVILTLFVIGILRVYQILREGFQRFTYSHNDLHNSVFEEETKIDKPYSRFSAIAFLIIGLIISVSLGILIGNYMGIFISVMMSKLSSPTLKPDLVFYPPIIALLVDIMRSIVTKFEDRLPPT